MFNFWCAMVFSLSMASNGTLNGLALESPNPQYMGIEDPLAISSGLVLGMDKFFLEGSLTRDVSQLQNRVLGKEAYNLRLGYIIKDGVEVGYEYNYKSPCTIYVRFGPHTTRPARMMKYDRIEMQEVFYREF